MTIRESSLYRPVMTTGPFAGLPFGCEARIADWTLCTKRIDLVCIKDQRMRAIELKVYDWKGAVRQAYANLYVADYSYVGLWHETAARVDRAPFKRSGIGLLEVSRKACTLAVRPKRSTLVIPERQAYVRQHYR